MSLFGGEFFVREYVNCLNAVKTVGACRQEFADQSTRNQIIISDISQKWQSWKHYMCLGTGTQFLGLKSLKCLSAGENIVLLKISSRSTILVTTS